MSLQLEYAIMMWRAPPHKLVHWFCDVMYKTLAVWSCVSETVIVPKQKCSAMALAAFFSSDMCCSIWKASCGHVSTAQNLFHWSGFLKRLTGRWRTALASSFFISWPSSGTCSILPLWANSRCVPGGRGWTSGRGVGPTGGGTTPWSIPNGDKHWRIRGLWRWNQPQFSLATEKLSGQQTLHIWSFNTQWETLWSLAVHMWFTHTLACCQAQSECQGFPVRFGPRTSSVPCCRGTAWVHRHHSRHMQGCTAQREAGGRVDQTPSRPGDCLCGPDIVFLSSLKRTMKNKPHSEHRCPAAMSQTYS